MTTIRILVIATLIAALATPGVAQDAPPRQVAESMWAAVQAQNWERVAGFMHPAALRQLRDLLQPLTNVQGVEGDSVRQTLFGSVSRDSAATTSDSAVYVHLMRFSASVKASAPGAVEATHYQFLGTVAEGKDTVHVIGRASAIMSGRPTSWIQVTSLMKSGSAWRGLLEPNWSQFAWALRAALTPQK